MSNFTKVTCFVFMFLVVAGARADKPTYKFDEFGDICCDEEKARLDNFAIQLHKDPVSHGFIVFYGGRRMSSPSCDGKHLELPREGEAKARAARLKPYLTKSWGLDPNRVTVIDGGYREGWTVELFIGPKEYPPVPTLSIPVNEIRFRSGKASRTDYQCGM